MMEEYLTADDIARKLKVSPEFVYKHAYEFGAVKVGKLVRFSKGLFNKIMEVKIIASLQAQKEVDVRLLEEWRKVQAGRVSRKARSCGGGSQEEKYGESDKYGLRGIMRKQIERGRDEKK
jgi:hypothetical protein